MDEGIFLFGAGKISEKYTEFLGYLPIKICGYIDNDSSKWGRCFQEKKIYSPDILKRTKNLVVITCADEKGITYQLSQMGMKNRIASIDYITRRGVEAVEANGEYPYDKKCRKKTIIVDNFSGIWGGAEDWAHKLALSLAMRGYHTVIIENTDAKTATGIEQITVKIDREDKRVYAELIKILLSKKPFTLINIWNSELLWVAAYLKKLYLGEVQIISSVLNDYNNLYQCLYEWDRFIDSYICISSRIKNNLINLYGLNKEKVYHREPFIENNKSQRRKFGVNNEESLKIGYPCRLTQEQKRADLLPELIEKLEKKGINYVLNIAGNGPCEKQIMKYIDDKCLNDKVKLYGKLSRVELIHYLEEQDIYLNFSEFEGTSLTMLEAMASGCVPVVTNVSGVEDFIQSKVNGMIADVGNIEDIADNILFLDQNRKKLEEFGKKCMDIVSYKCNLSDYMDYLEKLICE